MITWAKELQQRPTCIPEPKKVRGAKRQGIQYEKKLAKRLPVEFSHGVWWEYMEDGVRRRWCQTDFLFRYAARDWVVVLEAKFTWTPAAEDKLWEVYVPVVQRALGLKTVIPLVICKKLTPGLSSKRPVFQGLFDAIEDSYEKASPIAGCPVWHHIGGVPLLRGANAALIQAA